MSALRTAHTVWLMRRAAIVDGTAADAGSEPPNPVHAEVLYRVAAKVSEAVEQASALELTPVERTVLITEAHDLTERAAAAVRRADLSELERGEEWLRIAQALREVVEASPP